MLIIYGYLTGKSNLEKCGEKMAGKNKNGESV